ncbi:hypothetical protein LguiA_014479 [Lonicera macranthoides]
MSTPSHLKTFHSLHIFSMKPPSSSSSSTLTSVKLKTLLHTFIFPHLCRVARALTRAKSILIELLKEIQFIHFIEPLKKSKNKNKNKLFLGSFRLHYNWCSSHVVPVTSSPVPDGVHISQMYSVLATNHNDVAKLGLSGYLNWLEEKVDEDCDTNDANEIDQLADMFIANCHEKFRLEKQESYRRFQEMMARSV